LHVSPSQSGCLSHCVCLYQCVCVCVCVSPQCLCSCVSGTIQRKGSEDLAKSNASAVDLSNLGQAPKSAGVEIFV